MKRLKYLFPLIALLLLLCGCSTEGNITQDELKMLESGFVYGIVFIVLIFYVYVSLLSPKPRYPLYFLALLLIAILCSDAITNNYLMGLLNITGAGAARFIIYSSKAWILFFLTAYLHGYLKSDYSGRILRIVFVLTLLQQLYILLGINTIMPDSPAYYVLSIIYGVELLLNVLIVLFAILSKRKEALIDLLGILIIAASYFYKVTKLIPYYKYLMFAGAFVFLILQMLFMAKRIKKFYEEKRNAELRFLHAQIKPHYIFNALNTIISISRYNPENARQLLCDFSVYLQNRFNLKCDNQFTSLKEELEIVNVYLNIEKARFEERIEVEMLLPERDDFNVPVCVLQPIVENAIVHGILNKPEGGKIFISIVHRDNKLLFTVRDNGVGMSENKIFEVLESDNIGHIGLSNINKRLKALYKNGLTINSEPGGGIEVIWEVVLNN